MTRTLLCLSLALIATATPAADPARPLKATFQTTDCAGATGLASVDVDRIERLQPLTCETGRELRQVLVTSGSGRYDVFTVAPGEAGKIEAQIQQAMEARRKALERSKTLHIDRRDSDRLAERDLLIDVTVQYQLVVRPQQLEFDTMTIARTVAAGFFAHAHPANHCRQ